MSGPDRTPKSRPLEPPPLDEGLEEIVFIDTSGTSELEDPFEIEFLDVEPGHPCFDPQDDIISLGEAPELSEDNSFLLSIDPLDLGGEELDLELSAEQFSLGLDEGLGHGHSAIPEGDFADSFDEEIDLGLGPESDEFETDEEIVLIQDDNVEDEPLEFDSGDDDSVVLELVDEPDFAKIRPEQPGEGMKDFPAERPAKTASTEDLIAVEDREIRDLLGVQPRSHQLWQSRCRIQLERIGNAADMIVQRRLHESVAELGSVLRDIIANCDQDPDDIREEINLPAILDRLASNLEDYLSVAPRALHSQEARERMKPIEEMVRHGSSELKNLLQRMRDNDGDDVAIRARVLSKVFKQPDLS